MCKRAGRDLQGMVGHARQQQAGAVTQQLGPKWRYTDVMPIKMKVSLLCPPPLNSAVCQTVSYGFTPTQKALGSLLKGLGSLMKGPKQMQEEVFIHCRGK